MTHPDKKLKSNRRKRSPSRSSTPSEDGAHHRGKDTSLHKSSSSRRSNPGLPQGAEPISSDDFFKKSLEFKFWLKNKKNKFIDQLDSQKSKKYFEKFVRHWNKGKLDQDYYNPIILIKALNNLTSPGHWRTTSSAAMSSHSWSFKGATTLDREKARMALQEASIGPSLPVTTGPKKTIIGPSLPPSTILPSSSSSNLAEYQYNLDQEHDSKLQESIVRKNEAKRKRTEEKEEEIADRASGKERLLEKRKEKRDAQSEYQRQKDDPTGPELDDRNLFGSSNSFQEAIRARDRARERRTGKNGHMKMEKQLVMAEKVAAMKSKEDQTMSMFKAMAASKFGPSAAGNHSRS